MNPMMAAIKKRKSGGEGLMGDHAASHASAADHGDGQPKESVPHGTNDLHSFVASLAPHEKTALKGILDKESGNDSQAIAKGQPSQEEHGKIAQASAKEDQANALEESQESPQEEMSESDEIGKSMLDSSHLRGTNPMNKPRNLGERVKQSIATKLKGKGKI